MNWKKHFYRTESFQICTRLYTLTGKETTCCCLSKRDDGMYSCYGLGFRFKNADVNGIRLRNGIETLYDEDSLMHEKNNINFCFYRFVGLIRFVLAYIGSPLAKIFEKFADKIFK